PRGLRRKASGASAARPAVRCVGRSEGQCGAARRLTRVAPLVLLSGMAEAEIGRQAGWAFGVDPSRPQRYSLRQSRYDAIAADISDWAAAAAARGERLSVLDVGCAWGVLLR